MRPDLIVFLKSEVLDFVPPPGKGGKPRPRLLWGLGAEDQPSFILS